MKSKLIAALLLVASLNVFAGPEEHIQSQVCFTLDQIADSSIPTEICLETATLNLTSESLEIYSYFQEYAELYKNLKIDYLARKNEDFYTFKSEGVVFNVTENGQSKKLTLKISGLSDNYGYVNVSELQMNITFVETNDYPSSVSKSTIYNYRLR